MSWRMLIDAPWEPPNFEEITEVSLSTSPHAMSSPSSKPKIYSLLQSRNEGEKIVWDTLLIEALCKEPHLHWIEDLQSFSLTAEELSGFFHAMETMQFDQDRTIQKNLFLFTSAKKTLEMLQCSESALLKASYQFFLFSYHFDKIEFSFQSFLENATKTLSASEEVIYSRLVRYIKTATSPQNPDAINFMKAAIQLFCRQDDTFDWLSLFLNACNETTLENTSPIAQLTKALEELVKEKALDEDCFVSRVYQRYQQILKTAALSSILSGTDQNTSIIFLHLPAMRLAHTVVTKQQPLLTLDNTCTKSDHFEHIKLHYNVCSKDSFIFSRIKKTSYSSHIRVQLPYAWTETPILVALQKSSGSASLVRLRCTAELHQRFTGSRGIWPLLSTYLSKKSNSCRFHMLTPFSSSLESIIDLSSPRKIPILLSIFEDLACGLDYLHTNGYVHGMIDLRNAVVDDENSNRPTAGWLNFEKTCKAHSTPFSQGSYGSVKYSAPEILNNTVENPYQAEIWAFGQLMYAFLEHKKEPPWASKLDTLGEHLLSAKDKYSEFPSKQSLMFLICSMLQTDPTSRPNARRVKEAIGQIMGLQHSSQF